MNVRRTRRLGVAAAAAAGLALALLPATSASAVTIPDWPASRVPVGCPVTAVAETAGGYELTYSENAPVTITGWTFNGSTRRIVLQPGSTTTTLKITAKQLCSGVLGLLPIFRQSINGGPLSGPTGVPVTALSSNAFTATYGTTGSATPPTTGYIEMPLVGSAPRYDSFVLDQDFALVSKVAFSGATQYSTGAWSKQRVYLELATRQAATASKSTVAKGGTVTFDTAVSIAGPTKYVPAAGVTVKLQTKLPGQAWATRATRTTSGTGKASYAFKPGATMAWRWVLAENITTAPYWAGSMSAAKTITVT